MLSRRLTTVVWPTARIVRDVEEIGAMKRQPGRDMHALGGAGLVASLMRYDLVDELRLVINPILLGGGKALFGGVTRRVGLALLRTQQLGGQRVRLDYTVSTTEKRTDQ